MKRSIGENIKILAVLIAVAVFLVMEVVGIGNLVEFADHDETVNLIVGLVGLLGGPIVAYFSSLTLYGFGEIVDKLSEIADLLRSNRIGTATDSASATQTISAEQAQKKAEKLERAKRLLEQGLITEEEYQKIQTDAQ